MKKRRVHCYLARLPMFIYASTHQSFPHQIHSSKFLWFKSFAKTLKITQILIFVLKMSWPRVVNPRPLQTVPNFTRNIFCDWMSNCKIHENVVPRKFGAIWYSAKSSPAIVLRYTVLLCSVNVLRTSP